MGSNEVRIEIEVVESRKSNQEDAFFEADVCRVWRTLAKEKWLTCLYEDRGTVMRDLQIDVYSISAITLYDSSNPKPFIETYSFNKADQKDAFETLEELFKEYNVVTFLRTASFKDNIKNTEEDKLPNLIGPKRIEVILSGKHHVGLEKRLVVTDVLPPAFHFYSHCIKGRLWKDFPKELRKDAVDTVWSSSHNISRIEVYLGGQAGSSIEHYTVISQDKAWKTLEKLWDNMKPVEVDIVKKWDVAPKEDDDLDIATHWTNTTPTWYSRSKITPQKAHFRVAGDELGAVLYREQKKIWKEEGNLNPEQSLKEMLESKKKFKDNKKKTSTENTAHNISGSNSVCSSCGAFNCDAIECIDIPGCEGFLVDGNYTIH